MELIQQIIFWCFVALTIGSAIVVVFHKQIIYSAFALLFTLFGVAALYLYLSADFLAASQVLIYVGGILILLIFGVFMTARVTSLQIPEQTHQRYIALVPIVLLGWALGLILLNTPWTSIPLDVSPTTKDIGRLLLTEYLVAFELASILLLAALIGAMRLARFYRPEV